MEMSPGSLRTLAFPKHLSLIIIRRVSKSKLKTAQKERNWQNRIQKQIWVEMRKRIIRISLELF